MQGFVTLIGHHESKRLYEKCASSSHFMAEFYSEFIYSYAEGSKVRVSLCILLKEN